MAESSPERSSVVKVHLVLNQGGDTLKIEFPFDKQTDDIDAVVNDLIQTIGRTEADRADIRRQVQEQLMNPTSEFEPIVSEAANTDESSDDEVCKLPQYRELLARQRRDMTLLLQRHLEEKRELAMRIRKQPQLYVQVQGLTPDPGEDLISLS